MRPRLKMRLGDLLVHEKIITEDQLKDALSEQKRTGRKLGDSLIQLNHISEKQLLRFLAQQLNVPFLDIGQKRIDNTLAQLLPEVHARRHRAIIIEKTGNTLLLGMSDPADLSGLDQLENMLAPHDVELAVVQESQLLDAFDQLYRRTAEIESFASQLQEEYQETEQFDVNQLAMEEGDSDATVVKLLQSIFEDAVQVRASDIHIEPDEDVLRIRQRVDGVLQESILNERSIAAALVLRLKLMSGLDISEKRLPQDGRFNISIKGHSIDVRISTMPVQYGESVVMRLLDQSAGLLTLDETGMPEHMMVRFRRLLQRPHGMILVTGPTGSGKTTTLYGALSELNEPGKKIITVEDPVEYSLPRINQVQINPKISLTFSTVLRTSLRQDPDIIMVGEMRDKETADIGLRGALTGHLVLSTLHTNDAVTSALRLIDMGAPSYLVASSLRAIMAQRLVRRVCDNCKQSTLPGREQVAWLTQLDGNIDKETHFYQGQGCQKCNNTGYRGRIGVFELLELNDAMISALKQEDTEAFTQAARASKHYTSLALEAYQYAKAGVTSVEEVLKLVENLSDVEDD